MKKIILMAITFLCASIASANKQDTFYRKIGNNVEKIYVSSGKIHIDTIKSIKPESGLVGDTLYRKTNIDRGEVCYWQQIYVCSGKLIVNTFEDVPIEVTEKNMRDINPQKGWRIIQAWGKGYHPREDILLSFFPIIKSYTETADYVLIQKMPSVGERPYIMNSYPKQISYTKSEIKIWWRTTLSIWIGIFCIIFFIFLSRQKYKNGKTTPSH